MQDKAELAQMQKMRDVLKGELASIFSGVIKVQVENTVSTKDTGPKPLPPNNPGAKGGAEAHVEVIKPYSP